MPSNMRLKCSAPRMASADEGVRLAERDGGRVAVEAAAVPALAAGPLWLAALLLPPPALLREASRRSCLPPPTWELVGAPGRLAGREAEEGVVAVEDPGWRVVADGVSGGSTESALDAAGTIEGAMGTCNIRHHSTAQED